MTPTMARLITSHVFIDGIRMHARHGVLPQERLTGNDYTIDVDAEYDVSAAMRTDQVDDTLNYASVFSAVKAEMSVPSQLIEHVAGRIADRLLEDFPAIKMLKIRIRKENPPMGADCDGAGVEICAVREKTN